MKVKELIAALADENPDFDVMLMSPGGWLLTVTKVEPWWDLGEKDRQGHLVVITGEKK